MGWDWNLVVMSYHEGFSEHRRIIQQKFQQQVVEKSYRPVIRREIRAMLERILDKPEDYTHHLKRSALSHCATTSALRLGDPT